MRAPRGGDATNDCTAVRVPKYHSVRKVKKVFIVIFVVALASGVKSKHSNRERLFLRTAIRSVLPHTGDQGRSLEVDSAAPWQRAPPLDHVQVAAMRAAWHES